ncbi:MAG: methyltransferase family protein [Promethearchaeota archaeon]
MNDRVKILLLMVFYLPIVFIIMGALIFILANDFLWLEGWFFLIIFFAYILIYFLYSLIKDPEVLMKRGKYTTDDPATTFLPDRTFMILAVVVFGFVFLFPGFDHASNISPLPWFIELLGFFGLVIALIGITYVNKVNRYASKGLVIHKDHELITTGPYQYIRHPMYMIFIIFTCCLPLALGSFIAFLASLLFPILLIYRIRIEEKMLMDHLPGYKEYMERVQYRLIPKIY